MTKFIKITYNDEVVGAERLENPEYVRYQSKHDSIIICSEKDAQGITSENGKKIYQLEGKTPIESDDIQFIASFIDEYEYENLKSNLQDPTEELPDEPVPVEQEESPYMTAAEMRAKIIELTEMVTSLQNENEFLSDCLIEMSEVVYGEDE